MLRVEHLYKNYQIGSQTYPVLRDVSFEVEKGEFVAVMGPSGSGKSTLLNCIACYIPFQKGEIVLGGQNLASLDAEGLAVVRNRKLGFVFQDFCLLDGLTVFENICIPKIILHSPYKPMEAKAQNLMELFDITDIADKYPAEISGGQKQRTAVARALMNHPDLILADEPTGNLDSRSGAAVIGAFREAKEKLDATIFMVTHDSFSASHCDRVLLMRDGQVQKELKRQGSRREFMDILLDELKQLNERM